VVDKNVSFAEDASNKPTLSDGTSQAQHSVLRSVRQRVEQVAKRTVLRDQLLLSRARATSGKERWGSDAARVDLRGEGWRCVGRRCRGLFGK